jgi:ABC-type uncharacterized transport system YnjBCD ATPase subunit
MSDSINTMTENETSAGSPATGPARPETLLNIERVRLSDDGRPAERPVKLASSHLSLWYGSKQALSDVTIEIRNYEITALIGPSGCGKSTFLRAFNRMNDLIANVRTTGQVLLDGQDIYGRKVDVVELRRRVGMVFQKPNPFPKSVFENVAYAPRLSGVKNMSRLTEIVEKSARARGAVRRGEGCSAQERAGALRRAAAEAVHRPGSGGRARSAADGRALLRAGSDLRPADRGADAGAGEVHLHRHRDPQHAAGGAGLRQDGILPSWRTRSSSGPRTTSLPALPIRGRKTTLPGGSDKLQGIGRDRLLSAGYPLRRPGGAGRARR